MDTVDGVKPVFLFAVDVDGHCDWGFGQSSDEHQHYICSVDEAETPTDISEKWTIHGEVDNTVQIEEWHDNGCGMLLEFEDEESSEELSGIDVYYDRKGFWNGKPFYESKQSDSLNLYNMDGSWVVSSEVTTMTETDYPERISQNGFVMAKDNALRPDEIDGGWTILSVDGNGNTRNIRVTEYCMTKMSPANIGIITVIVVLFVCVIVAGVIAYRRRPKECHTDFQQIVKSADIRAPAIVPATSEVEIQVNA